MAKDSKDRYQSPLSGRYASEEMQRLFSDNRKFGAEGWRKIWLELARVQQAQGAPITNEQIAEILEHLSDPVDYTRVAELEKALRHDVVANAQAFGESCPIAKPIIALAATSCETTDNAELVIIRDALMLTLAALARLIDRLAQFAEKHKSLPTLGFTHYQSASLTTVGKRACMWNQNFLLDMEEVKWALETLRFRGLKGTTGTQEGLLKLFDGDHQKVLAAEKEFAAAFGFVQIFTITGQTYPRKMDSRVLHALSSIAQSASKMATDIRLLAHDKEIDEPFEESQKGSFGMPFKRNPMRSERASSLSRHTLGLQLEAQVTESVQWLERTLDDSADRRIYIPESFLTVDAILRIMQNVAEGLVVYPKVIERRIQEELPFMAVEEFVVAMVKAGADRFDCHERIRVHSMAAAGMVKNEGRPNDLLKRLREDDWFAPIHNSLESILDPKNFIGRAPQQVDEFLSQEVRPVLECYQDVLGGKSELSV